MSDKKKIVFAVVVMVVVIIVAAWGGWYARSPNNNEAASPSLPSVGLAVRPPGPPVVAPSSTITRTAVPANAVAPDKGSSAVAIASASVAVPVVENAGNPSGDVSYRSFNINVENNAFVPGTVIVKQGDTVNLEITAVDATYAFTQIDYGLNASIAKGTTRTIQFQALQTGNFTFFCGSCGGPSKGPVGHIIITANNKLN